MFDYKGWRKDKGLTQEQAAEQSGMSKSSWGRLERGQAVPEAFRIAADTLVKGGVTVVIQQAAEKVAEKAEMIQTYSPHAIETREFAGQDLQVIRDLGDDEILLTDDQLGRALDYAHPGRSIANLAAAHLDELQNHYTFIDLMTVDGSERSVRVWREQGVYLLTMFSVQPKAKDFRQFAAQTLYSARRQQPTPIAGDIPTWAAALLQQMGGNVVQVQQEMRQQQAQIAEVKEAVQGIEARTEQIAADAVKSHLAAAEEARMVIGSKRNYIERTVRHLGQMIADKVPALPDKKEEQNRRRSIFKNVWASVHLHAYVSKFDHVQTEIQCDRAIACLHQIANNQALVLPAYQAPMVGVAS